MSIAITIQRVHIELQRVQTWLFAVPRLRAMVGANALLGETLCVALPKLARETGRGWMLAPSSEAYPGADANDPLKDHDDPAADARTAGLPDPAEASARGVASHRSTSSSAHPTTTL